MPPRPVPQRVERGLCPLYQLRQRANTLTRLRMPLRPPRRYAPGLNKFLTSRVR